jgi:ferric-dicitrate binding protein FerR (iron transport regulator)
MIAIPEHIAIILEKQLKGLQSTNEMQVLEQWRTEKKEHELLYGQLTKLWAESGVILDEAAYDTNKAWEKLDRSLNHGKSNNIRPLTRFLLAACLTGVLILAGWMLFSNRDVELTAESNRQLTLPDGSAVILRKGASISYAKTFRERKITLSGEAYFDVQQDKNRPFRIQTTRATLEVLGTSFTINSNKNYDRLVVASGKVAIINKAERHVIAASEAVVLDKKGFDITNVTDSNYLSWQTGILKFDNTPVDQVAVELSSYYNLYIKTDTGLTKYTITAKFDHQSVEQVLEEIKLLANLDYRKEQDTIILFKP